jgi:hypothetical protein
MLPQGCYLKPSTGDYSIGKLVSGSILAFPVLFALDHYP